MTTLIVCPLRLVPQIVANRSPSHLITLLDPDELIETPAGIDPERHLKVGVNDIAEPIEGMTLANEAMVQGLVDFGRTWDEAAPLLIHCWAGISRSSASAFILACERNPHADEAAIARALRAASPYAAPNRRLVGLADDLLGRKGRMADAVAAMTPHQLTYENVPFEFAARY
jgi:predicted protein tyrosine phosphatase